MVGVAFCDVCGKPMTKVAEGTYLCPQHPMPAEPEKKAPAKKKATKKKAAK